MVDIVNAAAGSAGPVTFCPAGTKASHTKTCIAGTAAPIDFLRLVHIRTALSRGACPIDSRAIATAIARQAHV